MSRSQELKTKREAQKSQQAEQKSQQEITRAKTTYEVGTFDAQVLSWSLPACVRTVLVIYRHPLKYASRHARPCMQAEATQLRLAAQRSLYQVEVESQRVLGVALADGVRTGRCMLAGRLLGPNQTQVAPYL